MKNNKDIRVMVVEDDSLTRELLFNLIEDEEGFTCVSKLPDGEDILNDVEKSTPNVVLMDIELKGKKDGIKVLKELLKKYEDIPVIMHTSFADEDKIVDSLLTGAKGYLIKQGQPEILFNTIKEVINNDFGSMLPSVAKKISVYLKRTNRMKNPNLPNLSVRQNEVLKYIIDGETQKGIAQKLFISINTVRDHVKNIYKILNVHSKAELFSRLNDRNFSTIFK